MKKKFAFPWYIFLLPLFYTLHIYNDFFGIFDITLILKYSFYYLLFSAVVLSLTLRFFKNKNKAGVWTSIFLIVFFFWGATHDFLKDLHLPKFFVSYGFLLSVLLISLIYLTIRLKKGKDPVKVNRFFLYLFSFIFILEAGITVFYIFSNQVNKNDPASDNPSLNVNLTISDKKQMPDIFFMVFDEYTSSKALKKYYKFDNSQLDSMLLKAGFFISENSQSNYNATSFSIASTFNMQYFNREVENTPNSTFSLLQGAYAFKKSLLPELLEKKGYKIVNHGLCHIKNHPISVNPLFTEFANKTMFFETLLGRIIRDVLWNLTIHIFPNFNDKNIGDKDFIDRNKINYTNFLQELRKEGDIPKFVIGHAAIPHRPAYLDRYGNPRIISKEDLTDENHDKLYVEQVIYVNSLIDSLAKAATTTPRKRPLVLIIEGDHGNRYAAWGWPIREKQFMNLNTYYFSDKNYSMLYDSISPVNSFRVVLNKYFQAGLPLLKDSTIRLTDYH